MKLSLACPALLVLAFASRAGADPTVTSPFDPVSDCTPGLDGAGAVVAAGGDFDGDGRPDFAYAAPCASVKQRVGVGRIWVRSGRNGKVLRKARGLQTKMYFGSALAFVGDLDGDGRDELAVGAPGFDSPLLPNGSDVGDVGQVKVFRFGKHGPILKLKGRYGNARFGSSIAGLSDLDADGVPDLVVGAPGQQRTEADTTKTGAIDILSGADGELISTASGEKAAQRFGTTVANAGQLDADAFDDILVTSEKNPVGGVLNAGGAEVRSGADPATRVFPSYGGAAQERLGASSTSDRDGLFFVGAPGARPDGIKQAGAVYAFGSDGAVRFVVNGAEPQKNAQFGTAVAALGDVSGDGITDFAASEPFLDVPQGAALVENVGRIAVRSGSDGTELLSITGRLRETRLGRSLAGGIDLNGDGVGDVIGGNPGDAPRGRRSAGSANVYSGANGNLIRSFPGVHGFETRIFTVAKTGSSVVMHNFDHLGRVKLKGDVALGSTGALSLDVLDRTLTPPIAGRARLVVGTGPSSKSSRIAVVNAFNQEIIDEFDAFPGTQVGANVAAGDLDNDGNDELIVAEASSGSGQVRVNVYEQFAFEPNGWVLRTTFDAFTAGDTIGGAAGIDANGANVLVTGLRPEDGREIVAAPYLGAPVVRVFDQHGAVLLEWFAYDDDGEVDGLTIAAGDLDGDGTNEIVTAPTSGAALVRAFNDDGLPFKMPGSAEPVAFFALPEEITSGVRIATADLDLDDRAEILVVSRASKKDEILAFEADGSPVEGFPLVNPPGDADKIAIAATDRFVRR